MANTVPQVVSCSPTATLVFLLLITSKVVSIVSVLTGPWSDLT